MKILFSFLSAFCVIALGTFSVPAADVSDARQIAGITDSAKSFVDAFEKGDAKAVANFWMPDGDYVVEDGRVLKGRKAIEDAFAEVFAAHKGRKLRIDVASVRFPAPDLAIEDGTSAVLSPDGNAPRRARYTNVLIKKDGQWLLESVREAAYTDPSNYEHLRGLDWVIGEWVGEENSKGPTGHISFEWAGNDNFIHATRTADFKDASLEDGTQIIGWDPVSKQIRSWSFEADGGFGESTWSKDGAKWVIKTKATTADGGAVTATNIITPVGEDTVKWQSKDRMVNGKPIPDTKEITMKRVPK